MVDELVALAEFGQPVAITPFLLAGASAPVDTGRRVVVACGRDVGGRRDGAVGASGNAVHPGNVPQRCRHAVWRPIARLAGVVARNAGWRSTGPTLRTTAARRRRTVFRLQLDAQTATESAMSLWATYLAEADLVVHAAGWIEGGLVANYEKLALDVEVIAMFERIRRGIEVDETQLAFDVIAELGPGGLFLAHEHTLQHFRAESFMSRPSARRRTQPR